MAQRKRTSAKTKYTQKKKHPFCCLLMCVLSCNEMKLSYWPSTGDYWPLNSSQNTFYANAQFMRSLPTKRANFTFQWASESPHMRRYSNQFATMSLDRRRLSQLVRTPKTTFKFKFLIDWLIVDATTSMLWKCHRLFCKFSMFSSLDNWFLGSMFWC